MLETTNPLILDVGKENSHLFLGPKGESIYDGLISWKNEEYLSFSILPNRDAYQSVFRWGQEAD